MTHDLRIPWIFLAGAALALLLPGTPWAATLIVPATATVRGNQVLLSEIATIDGTAVERGQLEEVTLGLAPPLGDHCTITAATIRLRLRQAGLDPGTVTITCPQPVTVTRLATVVVGSTLAEMATQWLQGHLPSVPGCEMTVSAVRTPDDAALPPGKISWTYADNGAIYNSTQHGVQLTALVDGKPAWSDQIILHVQCLSPVLTVRNAIARNQVLKPTDLVVEKRDTTAVHGAPLCDPQEAIGLRSTTGLSAGDVLTKELVQMVPLVKRNGQVRVQAHCGALLITTTAIACDDGALGDCIRVRNENTREIFTARVLAADRLEVTP